MDVAGRLDLARQDAGVERLAQTQAQMSQIVKVIRDREVLGDQTYESLARKGETMTTAAMVTYGYDQIDQARTELKHSS